MHNTALQHTKIIQKKRKIWPDSHISNKQFQVGDWALLYDSRFKDMLGKLQTRWLGPYEINHVFEFGAIQLTSIDLFPFKLLVKWS